MNDLCQINLIHEDVVYDTKNKMPKDENLELLSVFFKTLGDATRLKILAALARNEMCVCDLASLLSMTQSAISHQLRILKDTRLVKNRRDGKIVYYKLDDEHVNSVISLGLDHVMEGR